jgi:plasmid stability protein
VQQNAGTNVDPCNRRKPVRRSSAKRLSPALAVGNWQIVINWQLAIGRRNSGAGGQESKEKPNPLVSAGITSAAPHCDSIDSNASIESTMATITIRQLDEETKTRLRVRAAHHGCSMEEEAREILRSALRSSPPAGNLAEAIRRRFAAFGGVELKAPRRDAVRELPEFDK